MSDPIGKLRGLTEEIKAREVELRKYFTELAHRLQEAAGGHRRGGVCENCSLETYSLETYSNDDAYYGFLSLDEDGLDVAYPLQFQSLRCGSPTKAGLGSSGA